jgi:antitoxin YefM
MLGDAMPTETTYTNASANLAALCDEVISTREPIVIHRQGSEDVALVAAAELSSLMETAHLLRSPKNAQRLLAALARAQDQDLPGETVEALRREFDLGQTP